MSQLSSKAIEKLRAWWWHRQGLDDAAQFGSAGDVFAQTGWARSVGGCSPYLTLFSRVGMSREAADKAVANLEIHELPSARACTYIVPAQDYSLALRLAQETGSGDMRAAGKLGVTRKEIDGVCKAVIAALKKGPLTPDDIRQASGDAVRSLGPEGQKKGMSSTLPLALGELQRAGEIRRISTNGRLDNQRYLYGLWWPNPLSGSSLRESDLLPELARRFFEWIAPARLADFQAFAGTSQKGAKSAVEGLKLEPIADDAEFLLPASLRDRFEGFKMPEEASYRLVNGLDSLLLLRRDASILLDAADMEHPLMASASRAGGVLAELPTPAIVDRGRVVGLWEYDPEKEEIAYAVFGKTNAALKKAVAETEEYVREQLGDARTFSLDSPKSRVPRIEALRKAK